MKHRVLRSEISFYGGTYSSEKPWTLDLTAHLYSPDRFSAKNKTLLFCIPGGGSGYKFFDLGVFETGNQSFAHQMTEQGFHVIAMDNIGTGENRLPESHGFLHPRIAAQYLVWSLDSFKNQIHRVGKTLGVGHSMGGMMATLMYGYEECFDALALLGSSAGGLDWGLTAEEQDYKNREADIERDLEALTLAKFGAPFPDHPGGGPSGKSIVFGGETPELTKALQENTCELFAAGGMMSMIRGSFKTEVEALDIPLFFAFGDHDIGIPPEDVPKDYVNALSTKLIILENTGHNHMAFSSIRFLTDELGDWVSQQS